MVPVSITVKDFGKYVDKVTKLESDIKVFTWKNCIMEVQMINYGATVTSIKVPSKHGVLEDVVLGFDNMDGYLQSTNPYMGATIGRVTNRIDKAQYKIGTTSYKVNSSNPEFALHGGIRAFDKMVWNYFVEENDVIFTYLSKDGEEGFPGDCLVSVRCTLTSDNKFLITYEASSTKPTIINLTNHSYFNLAGHGSGRAELYDHIVQVNADRITETNENSIPTGKFFFVAGTGYDLLTPKKIEAVFDSIPGNGLDDNFCINKFGQTEKEMTFAARLTHPKSGRSMEVYTNQFGVQVYTSNHFPDDEKPVVPEKQIKGKNGVFYYKHGAICFETQNYPDAINHANFPSIILNPGEKYNHTAQFSFAVQDNHRICM